MRRATWVFVVLALLTVATSALAVGKTTVDPNTPGAKVSEATPETDARLDQKVTYEARRKTVLAVVTDLAKMTGVTLRAGYNEQDWQVRDRRMNLFAKDLPLRDMMDSIAHVMKFRWSRTDRGGTWTYRLYIDRKTLLGAERDRLTEEERLRKRQTEARQTALSGLETAAGMPEADMEKLKAQSPYNYAMARIGYASFLPALFAEVPAAKQAWLSGEQLTMDIASLPESAQQGLVAATNKLFESLAKMTGRTVPPGVLDRLVEGSVAINCSQMAKGYNTQSTVLGDLRMEFPPAGTVGTDFVNPQSDTAKLVANKLIETLDGRALLDKEALNQLNKDATQAAAREKTDLGEQLTEHPDDPALNAKVRIKPEGDQFADTLAALAESSSFAVVSDSFEKSFVGLSFPTEKIKVRAVLDKLESICRYNWERHGSTLELRDRDWFRKRAAQVPEAWLEPWRKALRDTGTLDVGQLSQIAMLTTEQYWANIIPDEVLGDVKLANQMVSSWDLLKAYACLDEKQQAKLFTGDGLDLGSMSSSQWTTLARIFRGNAAFSSPDAGLRLLGKQKQEGKQLNYTFTATTSAGAPPMTWAFTTPKYEPPKKDEPKEKTKESASR